MAEGDQPQVYTWNGATGPFDVVIDPNVFVPTSTSRIVGDVLEVDPGETVIEIGSGCGVISIVAARMGASHVYGTDINPAAVACAAGNARRMGLSEVIEFRRGSLFEPIPDVVADVVIGEVSGVPDGLAEATGWFPGGFAGGPTGAEVPVAMLESIAGHVRPGGRMYLPTASISNEPAVLGAARRIFGRLEKIREKAFPLPGKVLEVSSVRRLVDSGVTRLVARGSRMLWTLSVWECTGPSGALAAPAPATRIA